MCFLLKKSENGGSGRNRRGRKPVFTVLSVFLCCVFWLTGCSGVGDFPEKPSEAEVSGPEDETAKEEDQEPENAEAVSDEASSSENSGGAEGFEIEENQVEEGTAGWRFRIMVRGPGQNFRARV